MSRFPPIPEDQFSDAQRATQNGIADLFTRFPKDLVHSRDDGVAYGPYSPMFYTDDIAGPWFALASSVMRQQRLTFREKELCIMAVLSVYDVPYVRYAHSKIGQNPAGFTTDQIQQVVHGTCPAGLASERETAVCQLALTLAGLRGPLDDERFEKARQALGRDVVAGVAHVVTGYIYVAMMSNIADVGAPEPAEGAFLATKNPEMEQ